MNKEALFQRLEKYLDGQLSEAEETALLKQIAHDNEAAEQLNLLKLERELADLMIDDQLEAKMEEWSAKKTSLTTEEERGKENQQKEKKGPNRSRPGRTIFLVALLLLGAYWIFKNYNNAQNEATSINNDTSSSQPAIINNGTDQEKDNNYSLPEDTTQNTSPALTPEPGTSVIRPQKQPIAKEEPTLTSSNTQQLALAIIDEVKPISEITFRSKGKTPGKEEHPFEKGYRLMGKGQYDDAIQVFLLIPKEEGGVHLNAQQYLAYIYFEQKKYDQVIPILESLLEIGYADESKMKWLLALSYFSTNEEEKGLKHINELAENDDAGKYQDQAKSFLSDLDE